MASAPNHMMDAAWVPCISSLPFFLFLNHSLYSPSLLHYLRLYMSLFGYRGGLEHSFAQLPDHCMAVSSVFPSWQWHYIHTDIILSRLPFFPLYLSFSPSCLVSFPSPAVVSARTLFSSIPKSILYTMTAKQTLGTLKQTASILCHSPICG